MQEMQEMQVHSLGREDPLEKEMATYSSILAWESHGQRNLAGYSPWGCQESDTNERLSMHTSSTYCARHCSFYYLKVLAHYNP